MTMIRLATHRALLDFHRRPRKRSQTELREQGDAKAAQLPGVTGATGHRLILEVNDRLAAELIKRCDEALASDELHESKRGAIEQTRVELQAALKKLKEMD